MTENTGASRIEFREAIFLALLAAVSSAILLTHLTQSYLWNDEGSTALLARTILQHGVPMQSDGLNSTSAEEGRDFTSGGIYKFLPWAPFYAAAASFAIFGESTFSARLPFALFGAGTIVLTYFLARELWNSRQAGAAGAVILTFSVPFLLLAGQSRYYTMGSFFAALALWQYLRILESRKRATLVFVVAAVLLMHTNQGYAAALFVAVAAHTAIWRRDKFKRILFVIGAITALHLPWLVWMATSNHGTFSWDKMGLSCAKFCVDLLMFAPNVIFPVVALALALTRWVRKRRGAAAGNAGAIGLALVYVAVSVPLLAVFAARPHFRYLSPLLPMGTALAGKIAMDLWRSSKAWTVAAAVFWLVTGLFPAYLNELLHEYKGPIRGIVTYLNAHAQPGDIVATSYEDLPIKFYTKLRVIGSYAGDDPVIVKSAKWIIPRKYNNPVWQQRLLDEVSAGGFKKIALDGYPDSGYENRESMGEHHFWTPKDEKAVVIYERVGPCASQVAFGDGRGSLRLDRYGGTLHLLWHVAL